MEFTINSDGEVIDPNLHGGRVASLEFCHPNVNISIKFYDGSQFIVKIIECYNLRFSSNYIENIIDQLFIGNIDIIRKTLLRNKNVGLLIDKNEWGQNNPCIFIVAPSIGPELIASCRSVEIDQEA